LSTTKWGTGNWVSENYLFFARTQKFFYTLPAINQCKLMKQNDIAFESEYRVILRFISASHASLSRIMSTNYNEDDMESLISIYMDSMVEMDTIILNNINETQDSVVIEGSINTSLDGNNEAAVNNPPVNTNINVNRKKGTKSNPNFVKSNSLGILSVARSHNIFGPLLLNWEGGYHGERKIQEVKPLLGIKRENSDWQSITLRRLYQMETIKRILNKTQMNLSSTIHNINDRNSEGILKIFPNIKKAYEAVESCSPLSAIRDKDHVVWIACRPNDGESTRSSVSLLQIEYDDSSGDNVSAICWMSPIKISPEIVLLFKSMKDVMEYSTEFCLLLPRLNDDGNRFHNMYYTIGNKWTERICSGRFEKSSINVNEIFEDWL
jgi:hypothetical protein